MGTKLLIAKVRTLLLLLFAIPSSLEGAYWPRWRGQYGDGISMETEWDPKALAGGPKILWKAAVGIGYSNVVIKDKCLCTMGRKGKKIVIYCFNSDTGREIWQYSYPFESFYGPQSTPIIDGEHVYAVSCEGMMVCLKTNNGKVHWEKDLVKDYQLVRPKYGFAGSPIIEGDLLILSGNSTTGNSYGIALDKKTGSLAWKSPPENWKGDMMGTGSAYATPVIYSRNNKRYTAILNAYGLCSIDVETGEPFWFYEWTPEEKVVDPIIFKNKAFISAAEGILGCVLLDISTGKPKVMWQNKNMFNQISTCVLIDRYLYGCYGNAGAGLGTLNCLDFESGKMMWEKNLGRPVCLSASNNMLIILTDRGKLHIAETSPKTYAEISNAQVFEQQGSVKVQCWTSPVLCNGKIYCRNTAGTLVCVDVKK